MRKIFIKEEAETNPAYGYYVEKRPLDIHIKYGVINLDKPPGLTSHEVSAWIKKILSVRKAGHGGTLDPLATGVLPIGIECATKAMHVFLSLGKEYVCIMKLHKSVDKSALQTVVNEFMGEIYQRPPMKASVKRILRKKTIYYIDILEKENNLLLLKVGCEAGTYIRKLCHDVGEALGCGAHMVELRRTRIGSFCEDESLITLQDLKYAKYMYEKEKEEKFLRLAIQPVEKCFLEFPKIYVRDSAVSTLCHGAYLAAPGVVKVENGIKAGSIVAVFTLKGEIIGLMKSLVSTKQMLEMERGIVAISSRILMERNLYLKLKV